MRPTVAQAKAAYTLVRSCLPGWRLPEADEVTFRITKCRKNFGTYDCERGHRISVSRELIRHGNSLLVLICHETCHLKQRMEGSDTNHTQHNRRFRQLGEQLCKRMGFTSRGFV